MHFKWDRELENVGEEREAIRERSEEQPEEIAE
jgi:hypothetical protein